MITPELIRDTRHELGMSQSRLAKEIGVTRFTVSNWEKGRTDPPSVMLEIVLTELLQRKRLGML